MSATAQLAFETEEDPTDVNQADLLIEASERIKRVISQRRPPTKNEITKTMDETFGTQRTSRGWNPRDASEAVEIAMIRYIQDIGPKVYADCPQFDPWVMTYELTEIAGFEPPQRERSQEQRRHQHYSTPIAIAWAAVEAAHLRPGDRALEPSAGLGIFVALAGINCPEVEWHMNEVEPVRHQILKQLFPDAVHTCQDALELASYETDTAGYDVVIMNPPFSSHAKTQRRRTGEDIRHVHAAGRALVSEGRLVAITGKDSKPGRPLWDELVSQENGLTMIWSKELGAKMYRDKGVLIGTRISVIERDSAYEGRPWIPQYDGVYEDPQEIIGSIVTELVGRIEHVENA